MTVPPACADVWHRVLPGIPSSWRVIALDPRREDAQLPLPWVLDQFLASVPGLLQAIAPMDALDRDLLYVRVHISELATLRRVYPKLSPALLEAAKAQACKDAVSRP